MRLIQAFLLLILLPVKLFAQTETPANLTEGVLAFSCASEREQLNLVLLDEQSEWRPLGAVEGAVVTEIDDGFRFEDPDQVGWIAYLQQDRQSGWTLNYLDEDGSDSFECVNENNLVEELAEAIASKVIENGKMIAARTFILEQELAARTSEFEQELAARTSEFEQELAARTFEFEQELASVTIALVEATQAGDDLMAMADELLTVGGFDADKVAALLEGSDISEGEKTTLATALGFAKDKPTLLEPVLVNIRNLLGM